MQNSIITSLNQKQEFQLNQKLMYALSILSMQNFDLIHKLENEAKKNPALVLRNRPLASSLYESEDIIYESSSNIIEDIIENSKEQIHSLKIPADQKTFLFKIVTEYLDDNLFINKKLFLKKYHRQKYLDWIKHLKKIYPIGIGAFTLQERFKTQLEFFRFKDTSAYKMIDEYWKLFLTNNITKLSVQLKLSTIEIQNAFQLIKQNCSSKILKTTESFQNVQYYQYPDLVFEDNQIKIFKENRYSNYKVCPEFLSALEKASDKKTKNELKCYINSAKTILNTIENRNSTLVSVAQTLFALRNQYFCKKHNTVKKITLKMLAEYLPYSLSTISRALNNKTIVTKNGIKLLNKFLKP